MNTPVASNSPVFDVLNAWKVQAMDGVDVKTGKMETWPLAGHMSDCWLGCVPIVDRWRRGSGKTIEEIQRPNQTIR